MRVRCTAMTEAYGRAYGGRRNRCAPDAFLRRKIRGKDGDSVRRPAPDMVRPGSGRTGRAGRVRSDRTGTGGGGGGGGNGGFDGGAFEGGSGGGGAGASWWDPSATGTGLAADTTGTPLVELTYTAVLDAPAVLSVTGSPSGPTALVGVFLLLVGV